MNTANRIVIESPFDRLFDLAADVTRWPEFLPHYRWVRRLGSDLNVGPVSAPGRVVEMAARHRGIPLWWQAEQRVRRDEKRIEFRHVAGITKGMKVQWTFEDLTKGAERRTWLVQIHHQFEPRWLPVVGPWFAEQIVGKRFVQQVAGKTLACLKKHVESLRPGPDADVEGSDPSLETV